MSGGLRNRNPAKIGSNSGKCAGNRPTRRVATTMDGMAMFDYIWGLRPGLVQPEDVNRKAP